MTITDKFTEFDNALAIVSTAVSTNVMDWTSAAGGAFRSDLARGNTLYVRMTVTEAFVSAGGATLSVGMVEDGVATLLSTPEIIFTSALLLSAQLPLGAVYVWPVPALSMALGGSLPLRYFGLYYVVATSTFSAGKATFIMTADSCDAKPRYFKTGYTGP